MVVVVVVMMQTCITLPKIHAEAAQPAPLISRRSPWNAAIDDGDDDDDDDGGDDDDDDGGDDDRMSSSRKC